MLIDYEHRLPSLLAEAEINLGIGDIEAIMSYLDHDKKNRDGHTSFVLLKAIEKPLIDQCVPELLVTETLLELMKLVAEL